MQYIQVIANALCRLPLRNVRGTCVLRLLLPHPCQSLGVERGTKFTHLLIPQAAGCPRPLQ
jgi:hypothetical protein